MSRGATYLGLLANLRQDEHLRDAHNRSYSRQVIRPRRRGGLSAFVLRTLRITKR